MTHAEMRALPLEVHGADYDIDDAAGTVGGAARRWRWTVEGLDELPGAALVALEAMADALDAAGGTGADLAALAGGVEAELRDLSARHGARTRLGDVVDATHPLVTAVETVERMLSAAGRAVAVANLDPSQGRLVRINRSGGGVPKEEVPEAEVDVRGLVGDRQASRRHHGRPFQAVSLFSVEVLDALAEEGHPIAPGAVGENLTVASLDWSVLRPGTRLVVGDVLVELSSWAPPCAKVGRFFADGRFSHLDHDRHPGRARAYAHVLRTGRIARGDVVAVLP